MQIKECHPLPESLLWLLSVFSMKSFSFLWLPRPCASNTVPSGPHHSLYPPPAHPLGQPFFGASSRHTLSFSLQGSCTCCSPSLEHFPSGSSWGGSFRSNATSPKRPSSLTCQATVAFLCPSLYRHPSCLSSQHFAASEAVYLLTCLLCFIH